MRGQWCYYDSYFSGEFCDRLIKQSEKYEWQDAVIGQNGESVLDTNIRKSKIKFLMKNNPEFEYLFDTLWKLAIRANNDWFGFHISKLDYVQYGEYDESYKGEYKVHQDIFWIPREPGYHRKLSCCVQLTDPDRYEGGVLALDSLETSYPPAEIIRKQGTILFFPSTVFHHVTPVTRGTRNSLVAWFDGPYWR